MRKRRDCRLVPDALERRRPERRTEVVPERPPAAAVSSRLFLALFYQKIVLRRPGWVSCVALLFVGIAMWIGKVEIRLFKDHTDDVVAGFVIGAICTAVIRNG
jgi:hypothetical protein